MLFIVVAKDAVVADISECGMFEQHPTSLYVLLM